jgi:Transglycosylase SLT domain
MRIICKFTQTTIPRALALLGVLLMFCNSARAQSVDQCIEMAANQYALPALLLAGVAHVESRFNPKALNQSHFARTNSVDIGLMQINSRHAPMLAQRFGIKPDALQDACTNASVGAYLLRELFDRKGFTWDAVGANNAACTQLKGLDCIAARSDYTWKVFKAMQQLAPRFSPNTAEQLAAVASNAAVISKPNRIDRVTITEVLDANAAVDESETVE